MKRMQGAWVTKRSYFMVFTEGFLVFDLHKDACLCVFKQCIAASLEALRRLRSSTDCCRR